MRYVKNGEYSSIITTNDITTSNRRSLSEVLSEQQQDIDSLKSNVKWIYKYGGVGSGGAGNGGTVEEPTPWKVVTSLDGVVYLKSGETAYFGNAGNYDLNLAFFKIQGRTFYIKITYKSRNLTQIINKTITPIGNNEMTSLLYLDSNDTISIVISDDEGFVHTFNINHVTKSYEFSALYVYADTLEPYLLEDYNMYLSAVRNRGVKLEIKSNIVVPFLEVYLEYVNWKGETKIISSENQDIISGTNIIYEDLGVDVSGDTAGYYKIIVKPNVKLEGSIDYEDIPEIEIPCNLIPDFCYLKVQSEATLYTQDLLEYPVYSNTGVVIVNVTPYQKIIDTTKLFNLEVNVTRIPFDSTQEPEVYEKQNILLTDRVAYPFQLAVPDEGCFVVNYKLIRQGESYTKTYYLYVKLPDSQFTWFPENNTESGTGKIKIKPLLSNLYLFNKPIHTCSVESVYKIYDDSTLLQQNVQNKNNIVIPLNRYDGDLTVDTLINIAINYGSINEINVPILTFLDKSLEHEMLIYQNKITYNSEVKSKTFIPKQDYHLLTIYKRAIKNLDAAVYYETCVYIDGVLEPSFSTMSATSSVMWDEVTCHIGNYSIEYLEVSYFLHSENNGTYMYENSRTYFNDTDVLFHYYSYCDLFEKFEEGYLDTFKSVYNITKNMEIDHANSRIKTSIDTIQNLALSLKVPVLLLEFLDNERGQSLEYAGTAFLEWMENRYNVQGSGSYNELPRTLNLVLYSPGLAPLTTISTDANKCYFLLDLLGTSTMLYGAKNYDLILTTNPSYTQENELNQNKKFIYSFNFKDSDPSTFLPESRFTLKADVVDSSHSNNATIGKFVNDVTTKFSDAQTYQGSSKYKNYIKNTLQGYPVLLFIKNSYFIELSSEASSDYYYMGIYSFNLGRDSEYNLGYKDLRVFEDENRNSILSENAYIVEVDDQGLYLSNFGVAEILENQSYFDFSQYDDSVLFGEGNSTGYAMFAKYKASNITTLKTKLKNMVSSVTNAGGYIFEKVLEKNMLTSDSLPNISYKAGYKYKTPFNLVPNYKVQLKLTTSGTDLHFSKISDIASASMDSVSAALIPDATNNILNTIDYTALSEYYVVCMALGLVDSVLKNMNLKTWNGTTFYTAFYDMDTSLGKDNAGNDTDPVAFSDYWKGDQEEKDGETILKQAILYKDWYDPDIHGYDTPSHYLFALAKYAPLVINNVLGPNIHRFYPGNIWARFRRSDNSPISDNYFTSTNSSSLGCLRNAEYFIDTYYGNYLHNVADILFNFNYRKKYLTILETTNSTGSKSISYNSDNEKFGGKRVHYVKDWLNKRFHLLDLYFGISSSIIDSIKKCNITTDDEGYPIKGEWTDLKDASGNARIYPVTSDIYVDSNNLDIILLQNAFSTNLSEKVSHNTRALISAEEYSPMLLLGTEQGRYIIKDAITEYKLDIESNGKSIGLGGSKNWTYVSNINPFIYNKKFKIDNDKITSLIGLGTKSFNVEPQICQNWDINTPAVKSIKLNSSTYSETLQIDGTNKNKSWNNLTDVDISNSKMSLDIKDVSVLNISANSIDNTSANIIIANCNKLESLSYNNSLLKTLTFTVPFKNNPNSKYVSLNKNKLHNGTEFYNATNNNYAIVSDLLVTCSTEDGEINIDGQNFSTSGGLTTLILTGFKKIYISNCDYLSKINIETPNLVECLEVRNCCKFASKLTINSDSYVNLSEFSNLNYINFDSTIGFSKFVLPEKHYVLLKPKCFNKSSIEYLDGKAKFGSDSTDMFYSSNYTLLKSDAKTFTDFTFEGTNLNFFRTFHNLKPKKEEERITPSVFYNFNKTYKDGIAKIYNANGMWGGSTITKYDLEDYKKDTTGYLSVGWYTGVYTPDADKNNIFAGNETISVTHYNLFQIKDGGKTYTFGGGTQYIALHDGFTKTYIHRDWLKPISSRVTKLMLSMMLHSRTVIDNDGNAITNPITAYDFFGENPANLTHIQYLVFSGTPISFLNFSKMFPELTSLDGAFCGCKASNITYDKAETATHVWDEDALEYREPVEDEIPTYIWDDIAEEYKEAGTILVGFLYDLTKKRLLFCKSSFAFNNISDLTVDYYNFLYWNNCHRLFNMIDYGYNNFNVKKTLTLKLFNTVLKKVVLLGLTLLYSVFEECTVLINDSEQIELPLDNNGLQIKNTSVTSLPKTFKNFKFKSSETLEQILIPFNWDLISSFPNVISFIQTFLGVRFLGSLPFNLFRRRLYTTSTKKITVNGTSVNLKLNKFSYSKTIANLTSCFESCKFSIPYFDHENSWNDVKHNYIVYDDKEYDYSNFETLLTELKTLDENLNVSKIFTGDWLLKAPNEELSGSDILDTVHYQNDDLEGIYNGGGRSAMYNYTKTSTGYEFIEVKDSEILYNYKHFIIPPDIFYACSESANLSRIFWGCNLMGTVPDNLFKINCTKPTISTFLTGNFIFPKKYKSVYEPINESIYSKVDVYYYLPENFMYSTNADSGFLGCKICLPYSTNIDSDYGEIIRNLYVFCFSSTLPLVKSLRYFTPTAINKSFVNNTTNESGKLFVSGGDSINGKVFTESQTNKDVNRITMNVMYDKDSEQFVVINNNIFTDVVQLEDGKFYAPLLLNESNEFTDLYGNTKLLINSEDQWYLDELVVEILNIGENRYLKLFIDDVSSVKTRIGKLGLVLNLSGADYSDVLNSVWLQFGYGNLLQTGIKLTNSIRLEGLFIDTETLGISSDLIFPYMSVKRTKKIDNTGLSEKGPWPLITLKLIEDCNQTSINAYNNSLIVNTTFVKNE